MGVCVGLYNKNIEYAVGTDRFIFVHGSSELELLDFHLDEGIVFETKYVGEEKNYSHTLTVPLAFISIIFAVMLLFQSLTCGFTYYFRFPNSILPVLNCCCVFSQLKVI
eukprot:TRINITY_DN1209_c0_g1_i1.p3 TRINITY_DN1209_c0_g1~~TRINITY_DN1209_c0_g1_i1.p3  ORF type:complete len:109 (-),score=1.22 TRINITY_DN1209_c0_g1_i1:51-377(-)